jgi:hypothetical protein
VQNGKVILEPGNAGEFVRRQVKDNMADITQAVSKILGNKVAVVLGEQDLTPLPKSESKPAPVTADEDLLEKVKKEPVVQSFLDVFPGPVRAEKINS